MKSPGFACIYFGPTPLLLPREIVKENFKDSIFLFYCFKSNLAGSEGIFPQITLKFLLVYIFGPLH